VDALSGTVSGNVEYDPFGGLLRKTGAASACPIDYSTKYRDKETGLLYYGYRYLKDGRWLSKDPIEEQGGENLYGFSNNDAINGFDLLGLEWQITRNPEDSWAIAQSQTDSDDDIRLAGKLRLEWMDKSKWLKHADGTPVGQLEETKPGCKYKVPNTFVVYTSRPGNLDTVLTWGPFRTLANSFRLYAQAKGNEYAQHRYHVIRNINASSDDTFTQAWNTDGIVGYAFGGHGTEFGFSATGNGETAVGPQDVHPPYKLQGIYAYACYTANGVDVSSGDPIQPGQRIPKPRYIGWKDLVKSLTGRFVGYRGETSRLNVLITGESTGDANIP
jgi:RHS repeat-associated protein